MLDWLMGTVEVPAWLWVLWLVSAWLLLLLELTDWYLDRQMRKLNQKIEEILRKKDVDRG